MRHWRRNLQQFQTFFCELLEWCVVSWSRHCYVKKCEQMFSDWKMIQNTVRSFKHKTLILTNVFVPFLKSLLLAIRSYSCCETQTNRQAFQTNCCYCCFEWIKFSLFPSDSICESGKVTHFVLVDACEIQILMSDTNSLHCFSKEHIGFD